jgi:hypothetical protein
MGAKAGLKRNRNQLSIGCRPPNAEWSYAKLRQIEDAIAVSQIENNAGRGVQPSRKAPNLHLTSSEFATF